METNKQKLREINSIVYNYFNLGYEEIGRTLEKVKKLLDIDVFSVDVSPLEENLMNLTYTKEGVLDLLSKRNIKRIIEVNKIFRELSINKKLPSDFIERWYEFIEMYYYSHALKVKEKFIQYKDNYSDEVKEKREDYIEITELFIDLHTSLAGINIFEFETGMRSFFITDELRELCKDL
jgi:hypothetical protein